MVKQWKPTATGGAVTSQALYPVELINGVSTFAAGNSGEASGSTLRGLMTNTIPAAVYGYASTAAFCLLTGVPLGDPGAVFKAALMVVISLILGNLTANGKIDHAALPAPQLTSVKLESGAASSRRRKEAG